MPEERKEFCEYMYNRILNKLEHQYELLSFALISMNLLLRQSDILRLKWEQFDFKNNKLNNVYLTKESNMRKKDIVIDSYDLNDDLVFALQMWYEESEDKINVFPKLKKYQAGRKIAELIGDNRFCNYDLRSIGIFLKAHCVIN